MSARGNLRVANKAQTVRDLGLAIERLQDTRIALYREVVWRIFTHIVRNTPAYSGAAQAHWVIGIGAPATFYNPSLGRPDSTRALTRSGAMTPLQKGGDGYWARVARDRERPKLAFIRRDSKIFVTNGVLGDQDNGRSSKNYLDSLQDPGYWSTKLRAVNQPYIVAAESGIAIAAQYAGKKIDPFAWAPTFAEDE